MSYSFDRLLAELERDEGLRLRPYQDTVGKTTIGIGRNLDDVGISADEAREMCARDIARAESALTTILPTWRGLTDARQRVLLNMAFNIGPTRLAGFKAMITAIRAGDFARASEEMLDSLWAAQVGQRALRLAEMMRRG